MPNRLLSTKRVCRKCNQVDEHLPDCPVALEMRKNAHPAFQRLKREWDRAKIRERCTK